MQESEPKFSQARAPAKILDAYQNFNDQPGFAAVVTNEDTLAKAATSPFLVCQESEEIQGPDDSQSLSDTWTSFEDDGRDFWTEMDSLVECWMASWQRRPAMPDTIKRTTGTKVAFGDVVQLSKERSKDPEADGFERYIGLEHLEPSDLKVRSWGDLADGVTFTNVFRPGQVLFGKRRAYQRKVAVADFSGVCSGDIYVLEPKGEQLLPELLPFICQSESFYDYVISMSQGGLSPRVNWEALAKYEFALPPLEEQRRIAEVLQRSSEKKRVDSKRSCS